MKKIEIIAIKPPTCVWCDLIKIEDEYYATVSFYGDSFLKKITKEQYEERLKYQPKIFKDVLDK